jgi:hypothetical protein
MNVSTWPNALNYSVVMQRSGMDAPLHCRVPALVYRVPALVWPVQCLDNTWSSVPSEL